MFATKLDMFSIGTITIPIHNEPIPIIDCVLNIVTIKLVLKQLVKSIDLLVVKLAIPPNIVKYHLLETFFHAKVGEMIIDETHARERV
jgi:hypothetical protein